VQRLQTEMDAGSLTSTVPEFDSDRTSMNLIFDAVCETKPVFAMLWQAFNFVFCCVPLYSIGFYHLKRCNTFLLVDIYL
jgi:hypothetical protein